MVMAVPIAEIGAMDLVEWHREPRIVDSNLDQTAFLPAAIGLGSNPLGRDGFLGPDDEYGSCGFELLLDHLGK